MVGAVAFSRACLETLIRMRAPLEGVVSLQARAAARHSDYADLAPVARTAGVEVLEVENINALETRERLQAWAPDALLILGWSQLLKPPLLAVPRIGAIGSHPALLPRNRGRHPVIWQLLRGETESGLTLFWLDESADAGPILLQERFALTPEDDAGTFYAKMTDAAVRMLPEAVRLLGTDRPPRLVQDPSQATYLCKRTERDGWIDWSRPAADVHALVRALTRPYVGATAFFEGRPVTVWKSKLLQPSPATLPPGTVTETRAGERAVCAGRGALELLESDPPPAAFPVGARFEACA